MSEFKLTLPEIHDLTPRQIAEVYFHRRDENGTVSAPPAPAPADPVAKLRQLIAAAPALGLTPDNVAKLRARLEGLTNGDAPGPG